MPQCGGAPGLPTRIVCVVVYLWRVCPSCFGCAEACVDANKRSLVQCFGVGLSGLMSSFATADVPLSRVDIEKLAAALAS